MQKVTKRSGNNWFRFEPQKELILAVVSLLWMWFSYYTSEKVFADSMLYTIIVSILLTMIGVCIILPVWWVAIHKKEGIVGLGITTKNLGYALLFAILLGGWRFLEIRQFVGNPNLLNSLLFNGLAIWEVMFIFGWLMTRYERSFGKLPAIVLTAVSVGIYHIGTLTTENILRLCLVICVCGICYMITENIFTLWPVYWPIGCSASTLRSGMSFPTELIVMSAIILMIQILIIIIFAYRAKR